MSAPHWSPTWEQPVHDLINAPRCDDLIPEENEVVQLALKRLSPKEAYDRVYRMRRAFQVRQLQWHKTRDEYLLEFVLTRCSSAR